MAKDKYPLVRVRWIDAVANTAWFKEAEMLEWAASMSDCLCENVGWLVAKNKNYIVIASRSTEMNGDGAQFGQLQKIPRTWCKIEYLGRRR